MNPIGEHRTFRDHDVSLSSHACERDDGTSFEGVVLDLLVEDRFVDAPEEPRHFPDDVIGQAGEDLRVVGFVEPVDVTIE